MSKYYKHLKANMNISSFISLFCLISSFFFLPFLIAAAVFGLNYAVDYNKLIRFIYKRK